MVVVQAQIQTVEDIGWVATMTERRGCFAISTVAKAARAVGVAGSPDNWRCMVPEKFRRVELVDAVWQTAPITRALKPVWSTSTWMPKSLVE